MKFFFRSSDSTISNQQSVKSPVACRNIASLSSRNAFIHFLHEYRQKFPSQGNVPIWQTTIKAANHWNRMALRDKLKYIQKAHDAGYVYTSRSRRMNRILNLIRSSLLSAGNDVDLLYLKSVFKQIHLWKRKIMHDI